MFKPSGSALRGLTVIFPLCFVLVNYYNFIPLARDEVNLIPLRDGFMCLIAYFEERKAHNTL